MVSNNTSAREFDVDETLVPSTSVILRDLFDTPGQQKNDESSQTDASCESSRQHRHIGSAGQGTSRGQGQRHRLQYARDHLQTTVPLVAEERTSPTPLLLFKAMTRYMCLTPQIWLSRLIIRQRRLIRPLLLLLLKTATSRICPSNVRLVIFTTELHRKFSRIVETVAPLPTVDVMSVTVVRMTVAGTVSEQSVQRITSKETAQT